jgi:hypothetical protein
VTVEGKNAYETYMNEMFAVGIFPDVSMLRGGKVIKGCWDHCCNIKRPRRCWGLSSQKW